MTGTNIQAALNLLRTLDAPGTNGAMVGSRQWAEYANSLGFSSAEVAEMADALPTAISLGYVYAHVSRTGQVWHRLTVQGRRLAG